MAQEILDYQCGFWKGQLTTYNLFMLRCMLEKIYEIISIFALIMFGGSTNTD